MLEGLYQWLCSFIGLTHRITLVCLKLSALDEWLFLFALELRSQLFVAHLLELFFIIGALLKPELLSIRTTHGAHRKLGVGRCHLPGSLLVRAGCLWIEHLNIVGSLRSLRGQPQTLLEALTYQALHQNSILDYISAAHM